MTALLLVAAAVSASAALMPVGASAAPTVAAQAEPLDNCPLGFEARPFQTANTCFQIELPAGAGYDDRGNAKCLPETPYGYSVPRETIDGLPAPGTGLPGITVFPYLKACHDNPLDRNIVRESDDEWQAADEGWREQWGGLEDEAAATPEATPDAPDAGETDDSDTEDPEDTAGGDEPADTEENEKRSGVAGNLLANENTSEVSRPRAAAAAALTAGLLAALAEALRRGWIRGKAAELFERGARVVDRINRRERDIVERLERINRRIEEAGQRLERRTAQALRRLAAKEEKALRTLAEHRARLVGGLEKELRRRAEAAAERKVREAAVRVSGTRGGRRVRETIDRMRRRWDRTRDRMRRFRDRTRVLTNRKLRRREVERAVRRLLSRTKGTRTLVGLGVTDEKAVVRMLDRLRRDPRREVRRAFRTLRPRELARELRRAGRRILRRNPVVRTVRDIGRGFRRIFGRRRPRRVA